MLQGRAQHSAGAVGRTRKEVVVHQPLYLLQAVKIALEVKKHLVEQDLLDIKQVRGGLPPETLHHQSFATKSNVTIHDAENTDRTLNIDR